MHFALHPCPLCCPPFSASFSTCLHFRFTIEQLIVEDKKPDIPPWVAPVDAPPTGRKSGGKAVKML
jgi:hypothetical protein